MMKAETGVKHLQAKEIQRLPTNHQKLGRGKEGFSYSFQKEHGSADTLISDIKPSAVKEYISVALNIQCLKWYFVTAIPVLGN